MTDRVPVHGLQVARELHDFLAQDVLPGSGVDAEKFWSGFAALAVRLMPENRALLAQRDRLQAAIDAWHKENPERPIDALDYTAFLREIGYLMPEGADFQ
ncbi:MAG: malate synthase G, partial [Alphaproteobacteria bacterium]|nr:malate synthase G [Alphaproteobacteria bacterium]